MNVERYSDILKKEKAQMVTNQSGLTDFTEGSVIMTMLETFARRIEKLYIDARNGFNNNLKSIPYSMFNFQKKNGSIATGKVIFSRTKAINSVTKIPKDTEVKAGDYVYKTTEEGKIAAGATSTEEVSIEAVDVGTAYNTGIGTVTTIISILPSDVVKVTNNTKIEGGVDTETELEMYKRFINYINGLDGNNVYSVKAAVESVNGVNSVQLAEHFPPDSNGNNFTIYVDTGGEGLSSSLKEKIETVVDGDGTADNPGHKAPGIKYNVEAAEVKTVDIVYSASCELSDESTVTSQMNEIIKETVNSLAIGDDVKISELISALKTLSFVKDCSIITPKSNVVISQGQIAKAGTVTRN